MDANLNNFKDPEKAKLLIDQIKEIEAKLESLDIKLKEDMAKLERAKIELKACRERKRKAMENLENSLSIFFVTPNSKN